MLLGGNQGDAVGVAAFPKTRLLGFRWPQEQPARSRHRHCRRRRDDPLFARALEHVLEMEGGFHRRSARPRRTDQSRHHAQSVRRRGRACRSTRHRARRCRRELRRIAPGDRARHLFRALLDAGALRRAGAPRSPSSTSTRRSITASPAPCGSCNAPSAPTPDGEIGPNTRAAIAALSVDEVLQRYAEARRARYRALHHFWRFGRGWLARVDKTLARARRA